jgi:hypothetical protein
MSDAFYKDEHLYYIDAAEISNLESEGLTGIIQLNQ